MAADHLSKAFGQQFFVETRAGAGGVIGVQTRRPLRTGRLQFRHHHAVAHRDQSADQRQDRLRPVQGFDASRLSRRIADRLHRRRQERREDAQGFRRQVQGEPEAAHLRRLGPRQRRPVGGGIVRAARRSEIRSRALQRRLAKPARRRGRRHRFRHADGDVGCRPIQGGTVTPLAHTGSERLPDYPDVPTFKELGYDLVATNWFGLAGPADCPRTSSRK